MSFESRFLDVPLKVARNEVKPSSFAQRSAHGEVKIRASGLDRTGRSASATRGRTITDVQIGLSRPTDFATVQYSIQLPPIMFGLSEAADIEVYHHFRGKNGNIFGQILRNSIEWSKILIDHKNTLVFFQAVSGMSSWSEVLTDERNTSQKKQPLSIRSSRF